MKSIFTHSIVAALAILFTSLFMRQCSPAAVVVEEVTTVDTLYTERIVEHTDTIIKTLIRVKVDTVIREVPVPQPGSPEGIYSYDEFYEDSTYQVKGDILYKGEIEAHSQKFIKWKDQLTFIPTLRTVYRDKEIFKTTHSTRQPRFLAGAYLTGDKFALQQVGVKVVLVDNRFRQYSIGKDVLKNGTWMVGADVPLFYSKPK